MNLSQGSAQDPSWHFLLTYSHISCHRQEIIRVPSSRMPHTSSDNYQAPSSYDRCLTCRSAAWRAVRHRTGNSPPGKGYRCGSRGAYFLLPTAAILFSGGLEGPAWQDWELRHRVLPRLVLSRAYDGRPKAERLLSLQKLFDLFLPTSESVLSV